MVYFTENPSRNDIQIYSNNMDDLGFSLTDIDGFSMVPGTLKINGKSYDLSATTIPQMYFSAMLPGPIHIHST
jgi:hypothetical protein